MGIWHIQEPDSYFENTLEISDTEKVELQSFKGRRKSEWLASRWLLHVMTGHRQRSVIIKDTNGKPHLPACDLEISISHTRAYTAVLLGPFSVGIDIQVPVAKITRIAHKFMHPDELANVAPHRTVQFLHVYWGAKESLYKAYGKRALDFKEDLRIAPFNLESQRAVGSIKRAAQRPYDIYFEQHADFILVYVLKQ